MPYDDEKRFVLFKDVKAEGQQPKMTGRIQIDGKIYRLAAWTKVSKTSGETFLSGQATLEDTEATDTVNTAELELTL